MQSVGNIQHIYMYQCHGAVRGGRGGSGGAACQEMVHCVTSEEMVVGAPAPATGNRM